MSYKRITVEWPVENAGVTYRDVVKNDTCALDYYLEHYSDTGDEAFWRERFANGRIGTDMGPLAAEAQVAKGSVLVYNRPPWSEPDTPAYLDVMEDANGSLVVVNKPAGLQVLPAGAFQQRVALTILRLHYADEPEKGFTSPAPVHRLGRGTSGLLLCARDTATRRLLSDQFQAKTRLAESILETGDRSTLEASSTSGSHMGLEKIYLAVASGRIESDEGFIDARIGSVEFPVLGGLFQATLTGKPALSHYRVLDRRRCPDGDGEETLCEVKIFSGRPHQIRIHMAFLGHPLVGDPLYVAGGVPDPEKASARPGDTGYKLHCYRMKVQLPDGSERWFQAPPPPGYFAPP